MSSPYNFVNSTGIIIVDTSNTLTEVQDEYKQAFNNNDLVVNSGPLAVLINAETESRNGVANSNAQVANQINPNLSGGVFLDAVCALLGIVRLPGTPTTVLADLTGIPGTLIPVGSLAQSSDGIIYQSVADSTLDGSGNAQQTFQATTIGANNLAIGSLNQIISDANGNTILGWETINNTLAGVTGTNIESDAELRERRNNQLGLQSNSTPESVISNVLNVNGVNSLTFRENVTNTAQIIDNVLLVPHSIYACVDGGVDLDVATALLNSKSSGSNWNGSVIVPVIQQPSGQQYLVQFDRPVLIDIFFNININPSSTLTDPISLTQEAVFAYAAGQIEGFEGFIVGANVQPFVINDAINAFNSSINALRTEVGLSAVTVDTNDISIEIFQKATILNVANINVNII